MELQFRWNAWNIDHATRHGVTIAQIEHVVRNAQTPYPRKIGDGKSIVIGRTASDELIQVVYVIDPDGTLYVIHAQPLTDNEKRRDRRRRRKRERRR